MKKGQSPKKKVRIKQPEIESNVTNQLGLDENKSNIKRDKKMSKIENIDTWMGSLFRRIISSNINTQEIITYILIGYIIGLIITIIWYNTKTNKTIKLLRWIYWNIVAISVIILSYSKSVRCTITLAIPLLCSSRGRSLIIAVAFFIAAIGPTTNLFKNIDVMGSSLTCGQMQLKQAFSDMIDTLKQPLIAIKDTIRTVIADLKIIMQKVKFLLLRIEELVMLLLAGIKNTYNWLRSIVSICNKEIGTPFDRCMRLSESIMENCREKLRPIQGICNLTHIFSMLCYTVKMIDLVCVLVSFISDSVLVSVMNKLRAFTKEIQQIFDVSITFDHDFYFQTTSSSDLRTIHKEIMLDIRKRLHTFLLIFGWLDLLSILLIFILVFKAIYFRMKYLRNPAFQNTYITTEFLQIDEARQKNDQERAMPLTFFESFKYPRLSDFRLTKNELLYLGRSIMFLTITSIQLFCICFSDYSLFWVLAIISYHGHKQVGFEPPSYVTVNVEGKGYISDIFRGIVHAFDPMTQNYTIDKDSCLPTPHVPEFRYYYLILLLVIVAWLFAIFEPYCLRLRHVVMRLYYPDLARQRAGWLYNKILLNRSIFTKYSTVYLYIFSFSLVSFFKLARRKARLTFIRDDTTDNFSYMDWLIAKTEKYYICRKILGRSKTERCLLCSIPLNKEIRQKCDTIGCKALYCKNCYKQSNNICCICHKPMEYGDFSDISDETDSSNDPNVIHIDPTDEYCVFK